MSRLPKVPFDGEGEAPWRKDPNIRKDRHVLVPDTVEWSGRRPRGERQRFEPIVFTSPSDLELRLPCWDRGKGRVIGTSSCTGLETPTMPFGEHAWMFLEIVEAAADAYLRRGWEVSRVDFARDVRVQDSQAYLLDYVRRAASTGNPGAAYFEERKLGVTFIGVAGGDRLRIYHKGLEAQRKFGWGRMGRMADVVRVELQLRRGQLDKELRGSVRSVRVARVAREPREDDIPVIRLKPSPGHGIRRRHLWCMRRDRHPRRAIKATEDVDRFLLEQELDRLLPGGFGVELPDPDYGRTPQPVARK